MNKMSKAMYEHSIARNGHRTGMAFTRDVGLDGTFTGVTRDAFPGRRATY